MKLIDIIKTARELTSIEGVVIDRPRWVKGDDFKADGYDENEGAFDGLDETSLVSLEAIALATAKKIGKPIKVQTIEPTLEELPHLMLHGYVENYDDAPFIMVAPGNTCTMRFAIAKELMHLYADLATDQEDDEGNYCDANYILQKAKEGRSYQPKENADFDDEAAAMYLAMEVMLPWSLRLRQLHELQQRFGENSFYPLAKAFMIPSNIVEQFCTSENYSALSFKMNFDSIGLNKDY